MSISPKLSNYTQITWICLRCLEKVKHIHIPQNGGLMVIYHGRKQTKTP